MPRVRTHVHIQVAALAAPPAGAGEAHEQGARAGGGANKDGTTAGAGAKIRDHSNDRIGFVSRASLRPAVHRHGCAPACRAQ